MKKLILMLVAGVLVLSSNAFADNKARIDELKKEGQGLIDEMKKAQEVIQKDQIRLVEINAVLTELQKQDEGTKKK